VLNAGDGRSLNTNPKPCCDALTIRRAKRASATPVHCHLAATSHTPRGTVPNIMLLQRWKTGHSPDRPPDPDAAQIGEFWRRVFDGYERRAKDVDVRDDALRLQKRNAWMRAFIPSERGILSTDLCGWMLKKNWPSQARPAIVMCTPAELNRGVEIDGKRWQLTFKSQRYSGNQVEMGRARSCAWDGGWDLARRRNP